MKASTERKLLRWIHVLASIPIIGFIYGPVAEIPEAVAAIRLGLFPIIVISGLWMWKGHTVKKWWNSESKTSEISNSKS
jgi:thiosulfate reductase cytochrome b subunit